ncbi:MAG: Holliday junction resolvase RuvX [Armatimonadetes bacterium]|nr:Holliday junction resolvase RuvX [Armatimonadota bacterium]
MPCVLALDIGEKTIGTALSDEAETRAIPGRTLLRGESSRKAASAVREVVQLNEVREIVVGLPLMMDGTQGVQVEKVKDFVATLRNYIRVPIYYQDERLSTLEAERPMMAMGVSRKERKERVDSIAASLFLQTYLDRKRFLSMQESQE